jgi:hypothetical protein
MKNEMQRYELLYREQVLQKPVVLNNELSLCFLFSLFLYPFKAKLQENVTLVVI